jgi:hypothetical protein
MQTPAPVPHPATLTWQDLQRFLTLDVCPDSPCQVVGATTKVPKGKPTLVLYGAGSFNKCSRGHPPSECRRHP